MAAEQLSCTAQKPEGYTQYPSASFVGHGSPRGPVALRQCNAWGSVPTLVVGCRVDTLKRHYEIVRGRDCLACGRYGTHDNPIEAAHLRVIPGKTGQPLRSHSGIYAYACIPLCRECHQEQHKADEWQWIAERVGWRLVAGEMARNLAEVLLECERR